MNDSWKNLEHVPANVGLPTQDKPERFHLYLWIIGEEEYVHGKFKDERAKHDASWEEGFESFWFRQIVQYYDRAKRFFDQAKHIRTQVIPLEQDARFVEKWERDARSLEMKGQQALAKAMMTAKGCVESSIRTFGNMPMPGVESGEVREWV